MKISNKQAIGICKKLEEEFVEVKFLSRGNHNESYILKTKSNKLVLRIENNHHFKNLKNEAKFLKLLNGKLAPKIFLFDDTHKIIPKDYLIEKFITGKHPVRSIDKKFIELMAKWYKNLHSNKNLISIKQKINKNLYYQLTECDKNIQKYKSEVSNDIWIQYKSLISDVKLFFKKNDELLNRRKYFSMVQGDPVRSNAIDNN